MISQGNDLNEGILKITNEDHIRTAFLKLRGETELPSMGHGWIDPDIAWHRVVGQICAVGNSRSWEPLAAPEIMQALSVGAIRRKGDGGAEYVHRILAEAHVRYCSPSKSISTKAIAIATNAALDFTASPDDTVQLLDNLAAEAGPPQAGGMWSPEQAKVVRRSLIHHLHFFGPKSASDFLLGLGLSDSVIAFDVRILNLLVDYLGWEEHCRTDVSCLANYERLEDRVRKVICGPQGITPLVFDRLLFQHYQQLKSLWSPSADTYPSPAI